MAASVLPAAQAAHRGLFQEAGVPEAQRQGAQSQSQADGQLAPINRPDLKIGGIDLTRQVRKKTRVALLDTVDVDKTTTARAVHNAGGFHVAL